MKIAVIGSGYVGLVAAACFAEIGHEVICVDNDANKVAALQRGETIIHEEHLPELLAIHRNGRLKFSGNLPEAVRASAVVFIAVGTPPLESGDADLSYVENVAREIARSIQSYTVIVEKSTVPVYTNQWINRVMRLTSASSGEFDIASNPEFLREGTAVSDFLYPDRIVIGADSDRAAAILKEVYRPLTDGSYYENPNRIPAPPAFSGPARQILTTAKSAELIKHASNAFLALKISFINAVANVCEAVGAEIEEVAKGVGSDSRIGERFLKAGIGYGGSCFPKDVSAFYSVAREYGYDFTMLKDVMQINEDQRQRFLKKVKDALWTFKGKKLGVLGLAFKGGTDDVRESPAIAIIESLLLEGCQIKAYDPAAMKTARAVLPQAISYAADMYAAAEDADALLILTDWPEFASLDLFEVRRRLRYPIVLDGRNLYSPKRMAQHGIMYYSVGRQMVELPALAVRK